MTQVSRHFLNRNIEKRMFEIFEKSVSNLKKSDDIRNYIVDLLTPTEKIILAKRLAIAVLLSKNYAYRTISDLLKVSTSTILSVIRKQAIDGRGYKVVVGKILNSEALGRSFLNLERTLGKMRKR